MLIVPLLIREGCPHLTDQAGEVIRVAVDVSPEPVTESEPTLEAAAQKAAQRDASRRAIQVLDNLRQGHLSARVRIDVGGDEVVIEPLSLPAVRFDLPGRQTKEIKQAFARSLIAGGCNGYLELLPIEDETDGDR